jgi:hypothetical protein
LAMAPWCGSSLLGSRRISRFVVSRALSSTICWSSKRATGISTSCFCIPHLFLLASGHPSCSPSGFRVHSGYSILSFGCAIL